VSKQKDSRLILKALCLTQALVDVIDEMENADMYTTNLKHKTKGYKNVLENILKQQMDGLFNIDEELMQTILGHIDDFSDQVVKLSLEELITNTINT
jgi:t-SNARE complex subunit (syntaxin)